ncbi:HoxN/HupN/NixA family nickel/cobalt transporter [Trinickia symbiotica]|uniref:Nickel/cobalt efflux system n=1 Tax=Trinickia symbiotica TaxID=863227 RepID=A0A2T3XKL4_9BURK|nr:HoxN/HupN/NixA family nickel/cobalt transporter [Trinickia symbiotica]PTB17032.1 HoxN/HupN/NixA family nickel/cobalt transporter [Trinickia symbiotica]
MSTVLKIASAPGALSRRIAGIYFVLAVFNIGAWIWAFIAFHAHPLLLGTGLLAYGFGLRHAVDADHIAAIDNVTRKLMQDGQRPVTVGFFFAIGHSAVVLLVSAAVAATAAALESRIDAWKSLGGVISTSVSALFLFLIAAMNTVILRGVWRAFDNVRRGEPYDNDDLDLLLNSRGLLARLFGPLFRLVSKPLWMLPLGFLFGLGFDTATEVSLLGISASQAAQGVSMGVVLVFPVLFAAGMSLVDTTDGILMLGAYDWAFVRPIRKLYYNLTITLVSVVVALLIGGIETLGLLADQFSLKGAFWDVIGTLNDNFNNLGFIIIGVFVFAWVASFVVYRVKRYDELPAYPAGQ